MGNAAAQELGVPLELVGAARLVTTHEARLAAVDALRVAEGVSLLRVGIGFYARTMVSATRELKNKLGWFAYPLAALREYGDAEPARIRLTLDGLADVFLLRSMNIGDLVSVGASFLRSAEPESMEGPLIQFQAREVRVESPEPASRTSASASPRSSGRAALTGDKEFSTAEVTLLVVGGVASLCLLGLVTWRAQRFLAPKTSG